VSCEGLAAIADVGMALTLRMATAADAEAIAALVNRAYRPAAGEQGWTHETGLVSGRRVTPEQLRALSGPSSRILLLCHEGAIVSCVHLQCEEGTAHIGMLATEPRLQGAGLGKQMLQQAEACAREAFQASVLTLSVLSARRELIAFYERRGYVAAGLEEDYPLHAGVGVPRQPSLRVMTLMKPVATVLQDRSPA
jgi:ribosomal protein S18 acetylase RimI-like enzyme